LLALIRESTALIFIGDGLDKYDFAFPWMHIRKDYFREIVQGSLAEAERFTIVPATDINGAPGQGHPNRRWHCQKPGCKYFENRFDKGCRGGVLYAEYFPIRKAHTRSVVYPAQHQFV